MNLHVTNLFLDMSFGSFYFLFILMMKQHYSDLKKETGRIYIPISLLVLKFVLAKLFENDLIGMI